MAKSSPLIRLGKLAAKEVAADAFGPASAEAAAFLHEQPSAAAEVIDLFVAESRKKRPSDNLLAAYAFMLNQGLEQVRVQIEAGEETGEQIKSEVVAKLAALGKAGDIDPYVLMMMLAQFTSAKLDIGKDLRSIMERAINQVDNGEPEFELGDIDQQFTELAKLAKGDVFAVQAQIFEHCDAFPADSRAGLALSMLQSGEETMRDAAVGWLLDREASVRNTFTDAIVRLSPPPEVNSVTLRRMIALRNWLPINDRQALDAAIKICRQRDVVCASWPAADVVKALATGIDGGGAQSLFLITKEKRKYALCGVLVKHEIGLRDAWVQHGMSRRDVDKFLEDLPLDVDFFHTTPDYVYASVRHSLAAGVDTGTLPPFSFFDAAESIGLSDLNPAPLATEKLVTALTQEVDDAALSPAVVSKMINDVDHWVGEFAFTESWYEGEFVVRDHIGRAKGTYRAILTDVLPARRRRWADRLAWTAFTLKQDDDEPYWQEFAVTARELLSDRDINDFAIMKHIAKNTSEALRNAAT